MANDFKLSIVMPVLDEYESLKFVFDSATALSKAQLQEVVFVFGERTTQRVRQLCSSLAVERPFEVRSVEQTKAGLGGALQAGISAAKGSHVLIMFSDLESDPSVLGPMLDMSAKLPSAIIQASRWLEGGGFQGYDAVKRIVNLLFQKFVALLYGCPLTDFTYGFRLYPAAALRGYQWKHHRHVFVLESILRPLRAGWTVVEVPARWNARQEGRIQVWRRDYLEYPSVALILRLVSSWRKTP